MASNDNQGLQIALIVFVILTLLLLVSSFLFFQQWGETSEMASKERQEGAKKDAALRDAQAEINRLKEMIGLAPTAPLSEAETTFKADMDLHAASYPAEKRRYRDAMAALSDSLKATSTQLAEQQAMTQDLKNRHLVREESKQQQIDVHEKAFKDIADKLAAEVARFNNDRERITADRDKINERFRQVERELAEIRAAFDADRKRLSDERQLALARANEAARKLKDVTRETFDVADGQIAKVNMKSQLVWVNLGRADDLRPQITFSVFGPSNNDVSRTERKGSVEVTKILGDHLAEARIIDDTLNNPIMVGDKIFTPAWHPGRKEHFALAGRLDIDGDGGDDRQTVLELIALAQGVVDAEVTADGQTSGKLTFNTRYLITGEEPVEESAAKRYADLIGEAESLGVERITIDKFLDHVGYKNPRRIVRFDRDSDPNDFRTPRPDGGYRASDGTVSEIFRQRRPPFARPANDK